MTRLTLLCLALSALPAAAHAPPLERLPDTMLAQLDITSTPDTGAQEEAAVAVAEEARTESLFLKLLSILVVPIGALLTTLLGMLTLWLKGKAKDNKVASGAAVLLDLLGAHLAKARAELGPDLKAALADGVLTGAEREALKKKLVDLLLRDAPADALKAVTGVFGAAFPQWLEGKAEQAIDAAATAAGAKPSP